MQFDAATLEKGLKNSLVRAYLLKDFALPLKGYTLKQLVGNQTTGQLFRREEWGKFLESIDQKKDWMAYPVMGPLIYQENLVTCHLFGDTPIEDIFSPTMIEACETYNKLSSIGGSDPGDIQGPLVFSYGVTVGEDGCGMCLSVTSSRLQFTVSDDPLPVTGITPYNPICLQIGLTDYMEMEEYPCVKLLGILADPNLDPQTKKDMLLTEFNVDIDRNREEDYEYLTQLEASKSEQETE